MVDNRYSEGAAFDSMLHSKFLAVDGESTVSITTVLNVDDNMIGRYTKTRQLQASGFHVVEAASGTEALKMAPSCQPDLILLDVDLPDINGYEVCRRLRADPATAFIPILQISAHFVKGTDRALGLEGGADGYLIHPADPREMVATINTLLRVSWTETTLRQTRDELERRIRDRTSELQQASLELEKINGELIAARDAALAATRTKSDIFASMLQAERERAESENRFRVMADSAPVLLWMAGNDGTYQWFNQKWLSFTGRTIEAELGEGWTTGIHPDDLADYRQSYRAAFADQEPFQIEYRLRRHDGEYCWILDTGTPRFSPDGVFLGYIGSCVDITERRLTQSLQASQEAQQRAFLKDVLFSVTEGRLHLCDSEADLPASLNPVGPPIRLSSTTLADVRRVVREAGTAYGFPMDRCNDLMGAASECAMNAVQHGGDEAEALVCASAEGQRLQVWVRDHGKGIDVAALPKATLMKGYSGGGGFGHGFFMTLQFVDTIYLLTGSQGTTVVIEQAAESLDTVDMLLRGIPS